MINMQLVNLILNEITTLEKEFQSSQGLILTEDDLKCQLFSKIRTIVPQAESTFNKEVLGSSLHAEVNFFDEKEKLSLRPDLAIIAPAHLSIFHSLEFAVVRGVEIFRKYSSKCFEIGGSAILIELKFCRDHKGISDADILLFQEDIDKLIRLQHIVHERSNDADKIYGVFALFNKTDTGRDKFDDLVKRYNNQLNIHVVYATGRVDFSGKTLYKSDTGFRVDVAQIC